MLEKPKNRGIMVDNLTEQTRREYKIFMKKINEKMQEENFNKEVKGLLNQLNINFKYKNTSGAVDDITENLNKLLVKFEFVNSMESAKKLLNKNKPKISSFVGGRFSVIQLRPYKSGAALVVFVRKRKNDTNTTKKRFEIYITIRPAAEEDEDGMLIGNKPKKNKKNKDVDIDPFGKDLDKVRARKKRK